MLSWSLPSRIVGVIVVMDVDVAIVADVIVDVAVLNGPIAELAMVTKVAMCAP